MVFSFENGTSRSVITYPMPKIAEGWNAVDFRYPKLDPTTHAAILPKGPVISPATRSGYRESKLSFTAGELGMGLNCVIVISKEPQRVLEVF